MRALSRNPNDVKPYSRRLRRGAVGDICDGRSATGRFIRNLESELVAHVGGAPTITQRLLIDRLIKIRLQLDAFDKKLVGGNWTPHDSRTHGGLLNAFRLTARELGLKGASKAAPTLAEHLARKAAEKAAREPEGAAA